MKFYRDTGDSIEEVWCQEIPEARQIEVEQGMAAYVPTARHPERCKQACSVTYDDEWGWLLVFEITHDVAEELWNDLFTEVFDIEGKREHDNSHTADACQVNQGGD